MRKIFVIFVGSIALAGCQTFNPFQSIANPVSNKTLAEVEAGYGVALSAAVSYRQLCAQKVIARANCAPVVAKLQKGSIKVQGAVVAARNFVKQHPTLDATQVIGAAQQALSDFQVVQAANGVK